MTSVQLAHVAAHTLHSFLSFTTDRVDREDNATLHYRNLSGAHTQPAQLGLQIQRAQLRNEQQITIRRVETLVHHGSVRCVGVDRQTGASGWRTGTTHRPQSLHEAVRRNGYRTRHPTILRRIGTQRLETAHELCISRCSRSGGGMRRIRSVTDRRANAVEPSALVTVTWHRERCARELLRVQAVCANLRRVLAYRQGARYRLRTKVVPETALVLVRIEQ
mmetsp:Transcript_11507/g.28989  ORF Transcript_11507/g.28989 Transcript_11507/m.28989 type:complete len:220 (-) Transcript_11507:119-778(-)